MTQFSKDYQPKKTRGKSHKTKVMESIKRQYLLDCNNHTTLTGVEEKFLDHIVGDALDKENPQRHIALDNLIKRCYAPLKATMPTVEFEFDSTLEPHEQVGQLLQAAADGILPPDVVAMFVQTVKSIMEIEEFTELRERIEQLEQIVNERDS